MPRRRRVPVGTPVDWIESSSAAEIADALLALEPGKAAAVAGIVVSRAPDEVHSALDDVGRVLSEDPVGALGAMLQAVRRRI